MTIRDFQNIHSMLKETIDNYSDQVAYKWLIDPDNTVSVTWLQF